MYISGGIFSFCHLYSAPCVTEHPQPKKNRRKTKKNIRRKFKCYNHTSGRVHLNAVEIITTKCSTVINLLHSDPIQTQPNTKSDCACADVRMRVAHICVAKCENVTRLILNPFTRMATQNRLDFHNYDQFRRECHRK